MGTYHDFLTGKHEIMISEKLTARGVRMLQTAFVMAVLTGCQSYQPQPLDLSSHIETWRALSPSGAAVRQFADEIAKAPPGETTAFEPTDGLSLAEGEIVALVFNPDLRIARSRMGMAEATAKHAGRWQDPTFNLNILKIAESVPDAWYFSSALSFTIPISGRLKAEKSRAEAAVGVEFNRIAEAEWEMRRQLRDAWVSWSAQSLRRQQTEAIIGELDTIIRSTAKLVELGELPAPEARLFRIEQESRKAMLSRLKASVAAEAQTIKGLLGLTPDAQVELQPSLIAMQARSGSEALADHNPTLARLRSEYDLAERTLLTEIRKQYPDLTIGPQAEEDGGQSRIGFIGGIPVPILNANKQGIAEARAVREVAKAAFETEYQRLSGRLAATRSRLTGILSNRSALNETLVPLVDQQVSDAYRLLDLGESNSLVLLESLVRAYEVKLQLIELQLENAQTNNEIRFLLGPQSPPQSPEPSSPKQ